MPLLTELEKRSVPACYRHGAPDGALRRRNKHIRTGPVTTGGKAWSTGAKQLRRASLSGWCKLRTLYYYSRISPQAAKNFASPWNGKVSILHLPFSVAALPRCGKRPYQGPGKMGTPGRASLPVPWSLSRLVSRGKAAR